MAQYLQDPADPPYRGASKVIFVVKGTKAQIGGSAQLDGTVLSLVSPPKAKRRAKVYGALLGPHPNVGGSAHIYRQPWVGWCDPTPTPGP